MTELKVTVSSAVGLEAYCDTVGVKGVESVAAFTVKVATFEVVEVVK